MKYLLIKSEHKQTWLILCEASQMEAGRGTKPEVRAVAFPPAVVMLTGEPPGRGPAWDGCRGGFPGGR